MTQLTSSSKASDVYSNVASIVSSLIIPTSAIKLDKVIGSGAFGEVLTGFWWITDNGPVIHIAAKRIKAVDNDDDDTAIRASFLLEVKTMAQLNHENICRILAFCIDTPPLIILEFVNGGSLHDYLQSISIPPTIAGLLGNISNAAEGLLYLTDHGVIHRDVAARNVLISIDGTRITCKLTDFGLSRAYDEYANKAQQATPIPVRWTAPEGLLYQKFSDKSDVWSFAVLMWEIFTCCRIFPYEEILDHSLLISKIESGLRLPKPEGCPTSAYELMLKCWDIIPGNRPHFREISKHISSILESSATQAVVSVISLRRAYSKIDRPAYDYVDKRTRNQWKTKSITSKQTNQSDVYATPRFNMKLSSHESLTEAEVKESLFPGLTDNELNSIKFWKSRVFTINEAENYIKKSHPMLVRF